MNTGNKSAWTTADELRWLKGLPQRIEAGDCPVYESLRSWHGSVKAAVLAALHAYVASLRDRKDLGIDTDAARALALSMIKAR